MPYSVKNPPQTVHGNDGATVNNIVMIVVDAGGQVDHLASFKVQAGALCPRSGLPDIASEVWKMAIVLNFNASADKNTDTNKVGL